MPGEALWWWPVWSTENTKWIGMNGKVGGESNEMKEKHKICINTKKIQHVILLKIKTSIWVGYRVQM